MNLNLQINACHPERLESFLNGDLQGEEEREFTGHLNICENCRRSLEQQAADPEIWTEAENLLKPSKFDGFGVDDVSGLSAVQQSKRQPLQIQNVLDALGPTDDPEMLGRLGGYEVSGVVGAGGMGVVLKAIDKSLDRTVAIKVLAPHLATSGAARKRFAREAKAAAAVLHPNVIAIHSVSNDESLPYLVMPYVRGTSLQKRLDREGPLALQEILRIGAQIAAGLAAAHAQGLVHRDIKPANILLEDGVERVTITDFGLARAVDDATITHSGVIAGTPQYMSPEQARGEAVDGRSDLFSLGSVLYAICTGRPPFRAETTYGVMRRITDDEPTAICEINPDIPAWLCLIIAKLMSKQADSRFASAAEVSELFEKCLAHVQQPAAVPLPAFLLPPPNKSHFSFISRRWLGVLVMIAAFGLGLLGMVLWQSSEAPDIGGKWTGEEWGDVVLEKQEQGEYEGSYTDTFKDKPGTIQLKWSRLERRFNGNWREDDVRFGKISVRLVDDEIRGAWTTNKKSDINPGTPKLADLLWKRSSDKGDVDPDLFRTPPASKKQVFVVEIYSGPRVKQQELGKLLSSLNELGGIVINLYEQGDGDGIKAAFVQDPTHEEGKDADQILAETAKRAAIGEVLRTSKVQSIRWIQANGKLRAGDLPGGTSPKDPSKTDGADATELKKFQGTWMLVSSEKDGEEKSEARNPYALTFTGTHWKVHRGDEVAIEGTLKLVDVAATPMKLDLLKPKGLGPDPTVDYGIYEWKENTLRYCVRNGPVGDGLPGGIDISKLRPTEFATKNGDGRIVYVWKRTDEGKSPGAVDSSLKEEPRFYQIKEVVLSMDSLKFMLDLDTGKTMDPPATIRPEQEQMDLQTDQVQPYHYPTKLTGSGLVGLEVKASDWNASAAEVRLALTGKAVEALKEMDLGPEKNPTYFFKTRDGTLGILQLMELEEKPKGIRLRYKTMGRQSERPAQGDNGSQDVVTGVKTAATHPPSGDEAKKIVEQMRGISMQLAPGPRSDGKPDPKEERKQEIIDQLRQLGGKAVPALVLALGDSDVQMRRNAELVMIRLAGPYDNKPRIDIKEALPALLKATEDPDADVRAWAAHAIAEIGPGAKEAVPALIKLLQRQGEGGRNTSCLALGAIGLEAKDALPALRKALDDPSKDVRQFAQAAIKRIELPADAKAAEGEEGIADPNAIAKPKWVRGLGTVEGVKSIAYSPDGNLVAVANGNVSFPVAEGWKRAVVILDAETGKTLLSLPLTTKEENAILAAAEWLPHIEVGPLAFSPDGTLLAVGTGLGQVKLFNSRTGELVLSLDDEQAKLAEKETPEKLKSLKRAMGGVGSLAFSPDGRLLAMSGSSFEDVARNWGGQRRLGRLATGSGRLKVWEVKTGTLKQDLVGFSRANMVAFSHDGSLLACAGLWLTNSDHGTGVIVWNPQTGEKLRTITQEANGGTHAIAFSSVKNLLVVGSRIFIRENDTSTTTISVVYPLSGITQWQRTFPGWVNPKSFSPDGKSVVALFGSESIQFLEAETGNMRQEIKCADYIPAKPREGGQWNDFAISPTSARLAIAGVDKERKGSVEIWGMSSSGTAAHSASATDNKDDDQK